MQLAELLDRRQAHAAVAIARRASAKPLASGDPPERQPPNPSWPRVADLRNVLGPRVRLEDGASVGSASFARPSSAPIRTESHHRELRESWRVRNSFVPGARRRPSEISAAATTSSALSVSTARAARRRPSTSPAWPSARPRRGERADRRPQGPSQRGLPRPSRRSARGRARLPASSPQWAAGSARMRARRLAERGSSGKSSASWRAARSCAARSPPESSASTSLIGRAYFTSQTASRLCRR